MVLGVATANTTEQIPGTIPVGTQPVVSAPSKPHKAPKYRVGAQKIGGIMFKELSYMAAAFGISRVKARTLCKSLHVPLIYIGDSVLFNESTLTRILYYLTKVGGKGFAAPGSRYKDKCNHIRDKRQPDAPATVVTGAMIDDACSLASVAEMNIELGKQRPSMSQLTKLISSITPAPKESK
jgi:hypothetical protein